MSGFDSYDRPPEEDPVLCSKCGVHIGLFGDEYCEPCARDLGTKPPLERCLGCGQDAPRDLMESVDVSSPDDYYPDFRYLCPNCSGGGSDA